MKLFDLFRGKTGSVTPQRSPLAMALEPRMMFDGAVAATVADAATSEPADAQDPPAADQDDGATDLAATPTSGTGDQRQEVVFVDGSVQDHQQLVAGLQPGTEVVVLDGGQDGLRQIADYLEGRSGIDAIHILSHGNDGTLKIGTATLNAQTLDAYAGDLAVVGDALAPDGDMLLYGCDIAKGDAGKGLVADISRLTRADVAASDDATGSVGAGGDWVLEHAAGTIETAALDILSYQDLLPSIAGSINLTGRPDGETYGATLTDGEGGTADVGGITYEISFSGQADGNVITYFSNLGAGGEGFYLGVSTSDHGYASADAVVVRTTGGEEFALKSFHIIDGNGVGATYTATGYRDGAAVTGAVQNFTIPQSGSWSTTVTLSADFQNVDEVRITSTGYDGGGGADGKIWEAFNNFVFDDPVVSGGGSPTTLVAGDIAVLGLNADDAGVTQRWAFVAMADIAQGTVIHFTDSSVDLNLGGNQFYAGTNNEGHMTWTVDSNITAGQAFVVTNNGGGNASIAEMGGAARSGVSGSVGGSSYGFTGTGDQIFVYQGTAGTTVGATFIYGLNTGQNTTNYTDGAWLAGGTSVSGQQLSHRPAGLVDGESAAVLTSSSTTGSSSGGANYGFDNMRYNGITTGTREQLLAAIGSATNWSGDNTTPYELSSIGNFTLTAPNAAPTITGATAGQSVDDTATVSPFSGVTITDADADDVTVTVALDAQAKGAFTAASLTASGFTDNGNGSYSLASGSAAAATTAIRQLVFDPADNRVAAGSSETTTFTITVNDGTSDGTNSTTTVVSTSVNDAPVLTPTAPSLTELNDNDVDNPGQSVSSLIGGAVSDVDSGALTGIAITGLDSGNGTWQYSLDGSTWQDVGSVSSGSALLLRASDHVRFVPDGADGTTASLSYRAWDQSSGTQGTQVDASIGGGSSAFSLASDTASITVNDMQASVAVTLNPDGSGGPNYGEKLIDGEGGTIDVPGIIYEVFYSNDGSTPVGTLQYGTSPMLGFGPTALWSVGGGETPAMLVIRTAGGEAFKLSSLYAVDELGGQIFRATAYRDGSVVGSQDFTAQVMSGSTVTLGSDFESVDEVRITAPASSLWSWYHAFNNFVIEDPVVSGPTFTSGATATFAENATGTVYMAAATATAGSVSYSLSGTDAALFSIDSTTGALTFNASPDYETPADAGGDNVYNVTITATDDNGATEQAVAISVQNANEAPTGIALANASVGHAAGANAAVGTLSSSDPDAGDTFTYSLVSGSGDTDNARFSIVGNSLRANDPAAMAPGTYSVRVQSTDGGGLTYSETFSITVSDDLAPATPATPDMASASDSGVFSSDNLTQAVRPTFSGTAEAGSTVTIVLDGGAGSPATVTANGAGDWTWTPDGDLTEGTHSLAVTATDAAGNTSATSTALTFVIDTSAATPTAGNIALSGGSGSDGAFRIGDTLTATWNAAADGVTDAASVTIDFAQFGGGVVSASHNGSGLWTATFEIVAGALDGTANRNVTVATSDLAGNTASVAGTSGATVDNVAPGAPGGTLSVAENAANATSVGSVTASGAASYGLTDDAGGRFAIDAATGMVSVANGSLLDFESATSHAITVRVTDAHGNTTDQVLSVTITDVNEAPTLTSGAVATLTGTDEDSASSATTVSSLLAATDGADQDSATSLGIAITASSGNGTWQYSTDGTSWSSVGSVSGSAALLLSAGTQLRYLPDAQNGETATLSFRAWDQSTGSASSNGARSTADTTLNGGSSAFSSGIAQASLTVSGVNDAPQNAVPASQAVDQDASLVFSSANGNAISISDVDAGSVQVTLTASNGLLTLGGISGLSFSSGDGSDDASMTFSGSLTDINAALDGLVFSPDSGYNGPASLQIVTHDQGNTGSGGAQSDTDIIAITVSPLNPKVLGVQAQSPDAAYKIGDVVTLTVTFDQLVNVDTSAGVPTLLLETGSSDRAASYVSGSGSDTLAFSYTVQAGDLSADLDYASTTALSLNGATIQGASAANAVLTLPSPGAAGSLAANQALVVDGVLPTASIVVADSALSSGETSTVTITFSEAVSGLSLDDFSVANGALSNLSTLDNITYTATLTPDAAVTAASNLITLDNSGVQDLAGNAGSGSTHSGNYAIDTQRPTASIVLSDTTLIAGETATVTITFSEAVSGLTTDDFSVVNGSLSGLASSDGGLTWIATLTPDANITSTNVDATSNLITLDNSGVQDLAGNAGSGSTHSGSYAIDTQRPTASIVVADSALSSGETSTVTITFSEAVRGLTTDDFSVANGSLSGLASSDGGLTWTATLTPNVNATAAGNLITLDNTGVQDRRGNTGLGMTDSNAYAIDTRIPVVSSVGVPADGTYVVGDDLDFSVHFDETVTVDASGGTPRIAIAVEGGGTLYADYLGGSGSSTLVFRLSVADGQLGNGAIALAGAIDLNGGAIHDAAGNDAEAALNDVGDTAGLKIDTRPPQVLELVPEMTQGNADSLAFMLTFDEPVSGVDLADFSLVTSGNLQGTLQAVIQLDATRYRIQVGGLAGEGSLGVVLDASASGITDLHGNPLAGRFASASHTHLSNDGDPEFRSSAPAEQPPAAVALQPQVPPPSPALFEQPTLGSDIPTLGNIFIDKGALAPSYIAQVFSSSDGSGGPGNGFLGFGGGDMGVFGQSTLASAFGRSDFRETGPFDPPDTDGEQNRSGFFGAPDLGQQLHDLDEAQRQPVRELARALSEFARAAKAS